MRTNKLLAGALVCLLSLSAITSCGKEEPKAPAPTQQTADRLINRVHIDSSVYMQAVQDFVLPTSVQDGDAVYPIKWTSDNEINAKIVDVKKNENGKEYVEKTVKIVRPEYDENAESQGVAYTLTAELTTGEFKQTKKFSGFVMMMENITPVENVVKIYEDFAADKKTAVKNIYEVKGYVAEVVKDGIFFRTSESDKAIYIYGTSIASAREVGENIVVKGPVEDRYGLLQFSYKTATVTPVKKGEAQMVGMPTPAETITTEKLLAMSNDDAAVLKFQKFTLEGTVLVDTDEYTSRYLVDKRIKFDHSSSAKAAYDELAKLNGKKVKVEVIYHGYNTKNKHHTLDAIKVEVIG